MTYFTDFTMFCILVMELVRQKHARSVEWNAHIITINPDYFFLSKRSHPNHKVTSLFDYSVKERYRALLPMTPRFTRTWFASTYVCVNAICCLVLRAHYSTRF